MPFRQTYQTRHSPKIADIHRLGTKPKIRNNLSIFASRQAADVEARIAEEEADQRARASEIRREKRMAKIKFMQDMDDRTEV